MTFEKPTTKAKMYEVLQQIFNYYRVHYERPSDIELQPLELERIEYSEYSDDEFLAQAKAILASDKEREIVEYKEQIDKQIAEINTKLISLNAEKETAVEKVVALYDDSLKKIEEQVKLNGITESSILVDQTTQLEVEKNNKITEIVMSYSNKNSEYTAEKAALEVLKNQADTRFNTIYEKKEIAKILEYNHKQADYVRDIFKYNNSLKEKEIKYSNQLAKINLDYKLKYLEIQATTLSKDELVNLGYYDDVLTCISGYYDSLSPLAAYQDFVEEKRLMVFLDDYYQNTLYFYKIRATT